MRFIGKKIDGPAWDGKEEPRLLGVVPSTTLSIAAKPLAITLDNFSWLDDDKYVKIYVEFDGAHEVEDDSISLVSPSSFNVA